MNTYLVEYLTRIGEYKITHVKSDIIIGAYNIFMSNCPDDVFEIIGVKKINIPGIHGKII